MVRLARELYALGRQAVHVIRTYTPPDLGAGLVEVWERIQAVCVQFDIAMTEAVASWESGQERLTAKVRLRVISMADQAMAQSTEIYEWAEGRRSQGGSP
jgi:hypothetical protein